MLRVGSDSLKMRALSGLDELKDLQALTEQCAARATVAKQQAQNKSMQRISRRIPKNSEDSPLAVLSRKFKPGCCVSPLPMNVYATSPKARRRQRERRVCRDMRAAVRRIEDPVSQARRHVAEAEARIERQKALVARLSDSGNSLQLAGQAREILSTLQQTLRLARDHLSSS